MSETDKQRIESLFNQTKQIIKIHQEYADKQGENFNIFSILRMERKEVETHSRFIYELLNPKGKHGQKDIFLKSFAKNVLGSDVHNTAFNPKREDSTSDNKRIDFTLETEKNIFGIEMKIDAEDSKNQLFDYHEELTTRDKNQDVKLFYLTLNGKEASEKSLGKLSKEEYRCISFKTEILNWINDCIAQSAEKSVLREALIQYKILIKKLTGQNTNMNTKIAELIGETTENFKSALEIEKGLTQAKINLKINFWQDLLKELNKNNDNNKEQFYFGNEFINNKKTIETACNNYYTGSRENTKHGIIYNFKDFRLMLITKNNTFFVIKKNTTQNKVKEINVKDINVKDINSDTEGFFYTSCIDKGLNFRAFDDELIKNLSDENRQTTIKNLAGEFKELIKRLKK
jgi:hypothetical protein